MVFVQLGGIHTGGWADNVGVFSGQNIQNSWDSHSPTAVTYGFLMGDYDVASCQTALLFNRSIYGMSTFDQDSKGNASSLTIV